MLENFSSGLLQGIIGLERGWRSFVLLRYDIFEIKEIKILKTQTFEFPVKSLKLEFYVNVNIGSKVHPRVYIKNSKFEPLHVKKNPQIFLAENLKIT